MSLVSAKDLASVLPFKKPRWFALLLGHFLLHLLRLKRINDFYDRYKHLEGKEFLDKLLDEIQANLNIPEEDLKRIPKEGPFITISNHPLGGLDGILLTKLMLDKRPDFKVLTNFLLSRIKPLSNYFLPVNPFEDMKNQRSSFKGLKMALLHLRQGHPLGLFPAGEVSTFREGNIYVDKDWDEAMLKLIHKANVPIVPIYFHAKNSRIFYWLSKIHPYLRTARLPSELFNKNRKSIQVRIGHPIKPEEQKQFSDYRELGEYLRKKTYLLAKPFEKPKTKKSFKFFHNKEKKIIDPVPVEKLKTEIKKLTDEGKMLNKRNHYEIFLADSKEIPDILTEISRLREVTFRKIGEGTGKSIDLDKYDRYYKHLFLWDSKAEKIVGAYRIGIGSEIYKEKGIEGFYIASLFRFEPEAHYLLKNGLELGRAFVVPEYQLKPYPLFLLWQGIILTIFKYPDHKYLVGGVSISDKFSDFSKALMIEFMKSNYYDPFLGAYIHPRKEFKVKLKDADKDFIFDKTRSDLNKLDKLIEELEPDYLRLPVLIKQYIKQNAKIIGFNVDPDFNNSIDALMYIRIVDIPEKTIKPLIEEYEKQFHT
jgi:putative hemolysin